MNKQIVIMFPGQGSQYVSMASEFKNSKEILLANEILGYDLQKIMLDGPVSDLTKTEHTQPAIVAYSICLWNKLKFNLEKKGLSPLVVLGHSVGEYSALIAANALKFEDAIKAVSLRGKYMQEAFASGGAMFAILKAPEEIIIKACKKISTDEFYVQIANYNEPNQIVISGHLTACQKVVEEIKREYDGLFRAIQLKVSAPFHSKLMAPATNKMSTLLDKINIMENKIPYIANIDANLYQTNTSASIIKNNLINQIEGSVLWTKSLYSINQKEKTIFIEVGPGKVLNGSVKRTLGKDTKVFSVDKSLNLDLNDMEL